ncbi:MAG: fibrinogen-like YCDxxxxGGGW domain-containing protein [Oligoflexus sp.]
MYRQKHRWVIAYLFLIACHSGGQIEPIAYQAKENAESTEVDGSVDSSDSVTVIVIDEEDPEIVDEPMINFEVVVNNEGSTFTGIYSSCLAIKQAYPDAPDGIYPIRINAGEAGMFDYLAACDMTVDGGGWTLILNYVRRGGEDPPVMVRNDSFPLIKASLLGDSEIQSVYWGHVNNDLARMLSGRELRFFCQTNEHNRLLHFKTSSNNCLRHTLTGQGNCNNLAQGLVTFNGHDTFLPEVQEAANRNRSALALTDRTFEGTFGTPRLWNLGSISGPGAWDCDNNTNNATYHTIHRVWLR